jgi:aquaporin Z
MKKYLMECIGTFFLVLVIGLSKGNALAIGAALAALVYMGGYVSGAHYNPAVTLAIWLRKKIESIEAAKYMLSQLLGAVVAAGIIHAVLGGKLTVAPAPDASVVAALLVEILFTFALVSVVLHVAVSDKSKVNQYYGIAIGFVVMAAVLAGGGVSGGAFNPAVGIGPNLYDIGGLTGHLPNIWLYLVGPFIGAIAASLTFGYIDDIKRETTRK